ncbi:MULTISPECIES: hypothetical protein [Streptomyces]|uniref:ATP-binding protein n=5 Tax=Streptomyces TaxID=1883 RepID=A0A8H9LQ06_9ACTN|nr:MULTISPECIES: hypothetical protein [Streptomyces]MDQ0293843.1 hypothetical protein [Streptomyces sp. DSM 41037]PJM81879.1 hypothetical protein CH313_21350 [Streptomyces sp. TSRI0384-2]QNE82678.1 hypothetical protein F0345_17455 [Streptomyces rutgersensis]RPK89125.1 hypothetical protein EES47_12510 [Streptomyces sp. ADI98-12]WSU36235.1 hypothetical protein OG378_10745 [Streptomyces gougerotii]
MKHRRTASAVAVSMLAAGAAAAAATPALAADASPVPMSLNAGVDKVTESLETHRLGGQVTDPVLRGADTAVEQVRGSDLGKAGEGVSQVAGAAGSLLGGVPLEGLPLR